METEDNKFITNEESSSKEIGYFVHSITNDMNDILFGLHSVGRSYIHHFSNIKLKYKSLAFTWLSALLIGLVFINQGVDFKGNNIPIDRLYIDALITILTIVGIHLLGFLDIKVYHPQLSAVFIALSEMESKNDFLRKEYLNMSRLMHKKHFDPILIDAIYYAAIQLIVALLGLFSLYLKIREYHNDVYIILLGSILIIFVLYEIGFVLRSFFYGTSKIKLRNI